MANRSPRQQYIRRLGKIQDQLAKYSLELTEIGGVYKDVKPTITFWLLTQAECIDLIIEALDKTSKEI